MPGDEEKKLPIERVRRMDGPSWDGSKTPSKGHKAGNTKKTAINTLPEKLGEKRHVKDGRRSEKIIKTKKGVKKKRK